MKQPVKKRNWNPWLPILSGEKKGLFPTLQRATLWPLSQFYRLAVGVRNRRFEHPSAITSASVPVISIGNLTTGGTGKTPMVEWVCRQLRQHQLRVALISRGYGQVDGGVNDEALELELSLPDVPHLQDPDRCKIAAIATEELSSQVLVMDDGFQHRKLHRDLDIVLIDATNPFGYGYCLPRGLLREPKSGLQRAHAVVITRVDLVDKTYLDSTLSEIKKQVRPNVPIATCVHRAKQLVNSLGKTLPITELKDKKILALSGIGNPAAFHRTLEAQGVTIVDQRTFPDHYSFHREDIDELRQWVSEMKKNEPDLWIVSTRKDLVKLNIQAISSLPLWALQIEIEFQSGQSNLEQLLEAAIQNCPQDEW